MHGVSLSVGSTMSSTRVVRVGASWDTQQRLPYNRNAPRKLNQTQSPPTLTLTTPKPMPTPDHVFQLLKRPPQEERVGIDDLYMGYERWLPSPPKLSALNGGHNPSAPKLYARRHFLFPALSIEEYNDRVMAVVRCEAQDALLQILLKDNFLSEEERNVLRWGKNITSPKTRTKKRAGVAVYNRASSLETLIGHLYLTDMKRLEEVMVKLGFSTDSSILLTSENATEQAS